MRRLGRPQRTGWRAGASSRHAFGVLGLALLLGGLPAARAQAPGPQDYRVIIEVPRQELDQWIKDEIRKSGGDLKGRYHFVLGFSTGHYGSDPVQAIATRRLVFSLLNNTCAPGDRLTPLGWELALWKIGKTATLTEDPATRAAFVNEVPYAPAENSRGGHDTERALYETLTRAVQADPASTIVLLLTNTNQSQGPVGQRVTLFGANNARLQEAIRSKGFRSPVRHSFQARTREERVNIDVTALFPAALKPLPGSPAGDRFPAFDLASWQPAADRPDPSERLPNPVGSGAGATSARPAPSTPAPAAPRESDGGGGFPWPLVLGLLAVGAITAFFLFRRKPGPASPEPTVPAARPLPGKIQATLGSAPETVRVELDKLTAASTWSLTQADSARPALVEGAGSENRLARLRLDDRRRLVLEAEPNVTFQQVQGVKADPANPRILLVAPGERVVCRVASLNTSQTPLRCEIVYTEK